MALLSAGLALVALLSNGAGAKPKAEAALRNRGRPVTVFVGDRLDLSSPDGRYRLVSEPLSDGGSRLAVLSARSSKRQVVGAYDPPTEVLWSPASDAFIVNDQKGSGQSSYLEVVRLEHGRFNRDLSIRETLRRLFNRALDCARSDEYVNTAGESWLDASRLVVTVQANLHSRSCRLDPYASKQLTFVVNVRTQSVQRWRAPSRLKHSAR